MRWRWPPENSCGYFSPSCGARPDLREQLRRRARGSRAVGLGEPVRADRLGDDVGARASAGSGSRTGPGRSSASAGAVARCRGAIAVVGEVGAVEHDRAARGRVEAARSAARRSTCRSPIRRPARASRRARSSNDTPSTACRQLPRRALEHAVQPRPRDVEVAARPPSELHAAAPRSSRRHRRVRVAASRRRASRRPRARSGRSRRQRSKRAGSAG